MILEAYLQVNAKITKFNEDSMFLTDLNEKSQLITGYVTTSNSVCDLVSK